jgi:hypothetical protein
MPAQPDCQRCDEDGLVVLRVAGLLTRRTASHLAVATTRDVMAFVMARGGPGWPGVAQGGPEALG